MYYLLLSLLLQCYACIQALLSQSIVKSPSALNHPPPLWVAILWASSMKEI